MPGGFYASGAGDRLIVEELLPAAVRDFLDSEERLLTGLAGHFDVLVEVGSMHGLHLDWAVRHDKSYTGLDVVERYIARGRQLIADRGLAPARYRLLIAPAERLAEVDLPAGRQVALFPFNSFGNMPDPAAVLDALALTGIPFMISTYGTDETATARRWEYYTACGYQGVVAGVEPAGVRFRTPDGLNTIAYHPRWLTAEAAARGLALSVLGFAEFGALYTSPSLAAALRDGPTGRTIHVDHSAGGAVRL